MRVRGDSLHVRHWRLKAFDQGLLARLLPAKYAQLPCLERIADEVVIHSHLLPQLLHQLCVVHGDC